MGVCNLWDYSFIGLGIFCVTNDEFLSDYPLHKHYKVPSNTVVATLQFETDISFSIKPIFS